MGKKCDVSDFGLGMIVGARQGGLSISETGDLQGFYAHQSLEFTENKNPVSSASRNVLLMREVRGEGSVESNLTGR